jgi:ribosomal protein S18 acetylase RimI-like enzyme
MNISYKLIPFDQNTPAPVGDLAQLHQTLLPISPVALLGKRFMEQFYYHILPREGLICGAVAYIDGQPAGFIVATPDSSSFMKIALRRHWWRLIWVIGTSVLRDPKRLAAIWEAWQIMRSLKPSDIGELEGELLSFGVLPAYRNPKFIRQSGLQISQDLFHRAVTQIQAAGICQIRAIVEADNTAAKLFYHGLGWHLDRTQVPGWRIPSVEFVWGNTAKPYPPSNPPTKILNKGERI